MNILILGDSLPLPRPQRIKSFNPATDSELAVRYNETYGVLLQQKLATDYPQQFFSVTNRAQRAHTIKHITSSWVDHLFFFEPDVVILQVGIVDCWFRDELNGAPYVTIEEFAQHLSEFYQYLQMKQTCKVLAIGIAPTSLKMEGRYPGLLKAINNYNHVIKSTVDYRQFFYIDMEQHIVPEDPHVYLMPDDHHLNKEGQKLVCDLLYPYIRSQIALKVASSYLDQSNLELAHKELLTALSHFPYDLEIIESLIHTSESLNDVSTLLQLRSIMTEMNAL